MNNVQDGDIPASLPDSASQQPDSNTEHQPLLEKINQGDVAAVKLLLASESVDVNIQTALGQTPLMLAGALGRRDPDSPADVSDKEESSLDELREAGSAILVLLLEHPEIEVNRRDHQGKTALLQVATWNQVSAAKHLLSHPQCDVNARGNWDETPLIRASSWGHTDVVDLLLSHPLVDINAQDDIGESALMKASARGHVDITRKLLEAPSGIQPNLINMHGSTAAILAAARGHRGCLEVLMTHLLIDLEVEEKDGETALMQAASWGHKNCVELLLNFLDAAAINKKDSGRYGESAFMKASARGHLAVVETFLRTEHTGVEFDACDAEGDSAVIKAAGRGHVSVVSALVESGQVDIRRGNLRGETALMRAAFWNRKEVVDILRGRLGEEINAKDDQEETALEKAVIRNNLDVVEALLAHPDCLVDCVNRYGGTPLMAACWKGRQAIVEVLLSHGADTTLQDNKRQTAMDKARIQRQTSIFRLLQARSPRSPEPVLSWRRGMNQQKGRN